MNIALAPRSILAAIHTIRATLRRSGRHLSVAEKGNSPTPYLSISRSQRVSERQLLSVGRQASEVVSQTRSCGGLASLQAPVATTRSLLLRTPVHLALALLLELVQSGSAIELSPSGSDDCRCNRPTTQRWRKMIFEEMKDLRCSSAQMC